MTVESGRQLALTSRALTALAHLVRRLMLDGLAIDGPATACVLGPYPPGRGERQPSPHGACRRRTHPPGPSDERRTAENPGGERQSDPVARPARRSRAPGRSRLGPCPRQPCRERQSDARTGNGLGEPVIGLRLDLGADGSVPPRRKPLRIERLRRTAHPNKSRAHHPKESRSLRRIRLLTWRPRAGRAGTTARFRLEEIHDHSRRSATMRLTQAERPRSCRAHRCTTPSAPPTP